ncbi:MAG: A/G-specific adenine glycosylase [Myxococcaceae bacterium]|nr:A/G-specific adenine glycosylase [Myxococcaceae bacterium]
MTAKKSTGPDGDEAARVARARDALLAWYAQSARALPWRAEGTTAWATWVSEVMLQQTRVETVRPYFARFMERFPTPRHLAEAGEPEVLAQWAGLGYYRRARFLHAGAKAVCERFGGEVPRGVEALRGLPGVGDYTAGAVASIAFGERAPLVDGNVERVLTRLFAVGGDPRSGPVKKHLWALAAAFADHPDAGAVNQSLMELGATVCAPTSPRCLTCPVRSQCLAARAGEPERYPEKAAKKAPRDESWTALVGLHGGSAWLVPSATGRWEGMLVPVLVEGAVDAAALAGAHGGRAVTGHGEVLHVLTHARMRIAVYSAALDAPAARGALVPLDAPAGHGLPKVTLRVLAAVRSSGGAGPTQRR